MRTLVEQLRDGFKKSEMTVDELLEKTGFDLDRTTLGKKLNGTTPMRTSEAEVLAQLLGVTLAFLPDEEKAS